MIRTLIVDDEPLARAGIAKLLGAEPDVAVIGESRDGADALEKIRTLRPDLVFLDVQMPELTGFEVLASLQPGELPAIVFVTAFDQYALDAFDANAVDYLLKPFDRDRFARALSRARRFLSPDALTMFRSKIASVLATVATPPSRPEARSGDSRLMIRTRGRITFVGIGDIDWIESSRNYVRIRTKGAWQTVREPLAAFATRLDSAQFVRVSRSCLVNLDRVRELRRQPNGQHVILLVDGSRLIASRRYGNRLVPVTI